MEKHVTVLGIIYIVFSILGIIGALITFAAISMGGFISGDSEAIMITSIVGSAIALFLIIISIPGIIGGIGLLKYKYWAKILVIILGILNLFNIPIGTIIGIYTLWVLFNSETDKLFLDIQTNQVTANE